MNVNSQYPINKTAALVTSKASKCNVFDSNLDLKKRMNDVVYKAPLKTIKFSGLSADDLSGLALFRSTVIGYLGSKKWLLKCSCGNYYHRNSKAVKSGRPVSGVCGECVRRYDMVRHNDYLKYGFNRHDINWYIKNR